MLRMSLLGVSPLFQDGGDESFDCGGVTPHLFSAQAEPNGFVRQPALQELEVVRAAEHPARLAGPDRLGARGASTRFDNGAMRRTVVKHEVVGRPAARVMRRGIDGLESAVRGNAGHASKRCREGPTRRRNAEHRAKRVREYDAMQASPAIVVLICRTEEGGRSE